MDAGLAVWLERGVPLRNKVAVMRLRDIHGRKGGQDTAEGSSLSFGLDYELRQIRSAISDGVSDGLDEEDAEQALVAFTRQLDDLREWYAFFRAQLGYLREATTTQVEVEGVFAEAKHHHDALCAKAGEYCSAAMREAGGPELTGFITATGGRRQAVEQFPELPPPVAVQPLDFSAAHSHAYLRALRRANACANRATFTARRTGRFWRTFPTGDPAAFRKHIARNSSRDGGWDWERFAHGDGLVGTRPMEEHLAEAHEALSDLRTAAEEESELLSARRKEEEAIVRSNARAAGFSGGVAADQDHAVPEGANAGTAAIIESSLHPELDALCAGLDAYAAAMPTCCGGWEKAWQGAMDATKLDGAVQLVEVAFADAELRKEHAYGRGAYVCGQHYSHDEAHHEVAKMARKLVLNLDTALASGESGASGSQVAAWTANLEDIATKCDAAHVAICLQWGVPVYEEHHEVFGWCDAERNGPDERYARALADAPEALAQLRTAQAAAKAEWDAKKAAEEAARLAAFEREAAVLAAKKAAAEAARLVAEELARQTRAKKVATLAAHCLTPYSGGTLTSGGDSWTYATGGPDGGHTLTCTAGRYAGSKHVWRANEDSGAVLLFGDPAQGMARYDGDEKGTQWISPIDSHQEALLKEKLIESGEFSHASYAYATGGDAAEWTAQHPHISRKGMPAKWCVEGDASGASAGYTMTPVDNRSPALISAVAVVGSAPPQIAIIVGMFGAGLKAVEDEKVALERERVRQRAMELARQELMRQRAASSSSTRRCNGHFARVQAMLCSSCGFGSRKCVKCNGHFARVPAMLCSSCGFGSRKCLKCNSHFARVPAMLCSSCGFGSAKCVGLK